MTRTPGDIFLAGFCGLLLAGGAPRAEAWAAASATGSAFVERFTTIDPQRWYVADGYAFGGDWIDTAWSRARVALAQDAIDLSLLREPAHGKDYTGGLVKSNTKFGFGRYEAILQPASGSGLVSAFFTYTGPYFGDPHHEIDFEFLGKDTHKVSLNYYLDGKPQLGRVVDLGFDAAAAPHHYAFTWSAEAISWYVDGRKVETVLASEHRLPTKPGFVYLQIWAGGGESRDWVGPVAFADPAKLRFTCVSFVPEGETGKTCGGGTP